MLLSPKWGNSHCLEGNYVFRKPELQASWKPSDRHKTRREKSLVMSQEELPRRVTFCTCVTEQHPDRRQADPGVPPLGSVQFWPDVRHGWTHWLQAVRRGRHLHFRSAIKMRKGKGRYQVMGESQAHEGKDLS